jgi:hypothetical protein
LTNLLKKAKNFSRDNQGILLEIYGLSFQIKEDLKSINSFKRKLKFSPFWFKTNNKDDFNKLTWNPSLYDTDIYFNI